MTKPNFKTGPQVVVGSATSRAETRTGVGTAESRGQSRNQAKVFEFMLLDPTIKLAVDIIIPMMKKQPWSIEGENPEQCEWIQSQLMPYRSKIIKSAFRGLLKDGWRAFETVYEVDSEKMLYKVVGIKPLRASDSVPLLYEDTGEYAGIENTDSDGNEVVIDERHSIFVNFDEEGLGELGEPLLKVARGPFEKWEDCDEGAMRYDQKVAGGFIFVQYPTGRTEYGKNGGAVTDNAEIAEDMIKRLQAGGYAAVPVNVDSDTGVPEEGPWHVEHVAAGGGLQPNFVVREKYLDALKLRAFGIPERSATEGTFGTKAEAEQHADIAIIVNMERHQQIVDAVNTCLVEVLNEVNYGDKHATRLVLGKLDPSDRQLYTAIFTGLMQDPMLGQQIGDRVDVDVLLDKLGIPAKLQDENLLPENGDPLAPPANPPAPEQQNQNSSGQNEA